MKIAVYTAAWKSMKIAVCTAVWKRHALTHLFYQWTAQLTRWWADHEVFTIAAGSHDPVHEQLAATHGVDYLDAPNEPLGAKFNAVLARAREREADAVLIMGSDDVFDEMTAAAYMRYLTPGTYVGLQDFWCYDVQNEQLGYWPGYSRDRRWLEPAGSGRLLTRTYLDPLDWALWDDTKHRGMDHSAFERMTAAGLPHPALLNVRAIGGCALAVKSGTNLWPYQQIGPRPEPDLSALDRLPRGLREGVLALDWAE